nr:homocysteine S-methyltransferase family protein [uncultured Desulfobulbus sp.]
MPLSLGKKFREIILDGRDGKRIASNGCPFSPPGVVCSFHACLIVGTLPPLFGSYRPDLFQKLQANALLFEIRDDLDPKRYADFTQKWHGMGVSIIGGCCGIGPEHIDMPKKQLKLGTLINVVERNQQKKRIALRLSAFLELLQELSVFRQPE